MKFVTLHLLSTRIHYTQNFPLSQQMISGKWTEQTRLDFAGTDIFAF